MGDLIIIGAGPAGLTAGLYAARAKMTVLAIREGDCGRPALEYSGGGGLPRV